MDQSGVTRIERPINHPSNPVSALKEPADLETIETACHRLGTSRFEQPQIQSILIVVVDVSAPTPLC
jgi:hypothetical protein